MHSFMSPKQHSFHKRHSQSVDNFFGGGAGIPQRQPHAPNNAKLTLKCNLTRKCAALKRESALKRKSRLAAGTDEAEVPVGLRGELG